MVAYAAPADPTAVMGRRIGAFLIDFAIGLVIVGGVFFSQAEVLENAPDGFCDLVNETENVSSCFQSGDTVYVLEGNDNAPLGGVGLLYGLGVFVVLQGVTGASIGKFATGLRVVNAQGEVCGVGRAALRWLLLLVDFWFCFLIGLITALATKLHRRVGDMAAGTFVVAKESLGTAIGGAPASYGAPQGYAAAPPPGAPPAGWGGPPGAPGVPPAPPPGAPPSVPPGPPAPPGAPPPPQ